MPSQNSSESFVYTQAETKGQFCEGIRVISDDWSLRSYGVTRELPRTPFHRAVPVRSFDVIW